MAQVLGVVATGLAAVFLVPQIARIVSSRDTTGVSIIWAVFGVVTNAAWIYYLFVQRLWLPALSPTLALATYLLLVALIVPSRRARHWALYTTAYVVVIAAVAWHGPFGLGVVLAFTPIVQITPEVVAVYRHPHPKGVSVSTWLLAGGEAMCWGVYGMLVGDLALLGYGLITCVGSALILGRCWRVRIRDQAPRSTTSTRPSLIALAAASPRLAAVSLRKMLET